MALVSPAVLSQVSGVVSFQGITKGKRNLVVTDAFGQVFKHLVPMGKHLLVREAETFRNDYRNTENRVVFHALKKPIPFIAGRPATGAVFTEPEGHMETQRYCGVILGLFIAVCIILSTLIIHRQNRMTR